MNNLGCIFLESGINFDLNTVCDCCISHNDGRGLPILIYNYRGQQIDWNKLFDIKAKRIEQQKEKTINDCEGCYHLGEYTFSNERKISQFHFSHCRVCNAKCIYCSDEYSNGILNYNTYPVILDLIEKGFYKAGGEATFQGGEPTLMQNFDELINLFIQNGTVVRVHTSAIKYSSTLEDALKKNMASVVISLDSACSKTYKKIKQVDAFDSVCKNIEKYIQASENNNQNLILKYIIIPGVNDNVKEIDKFFNLLKDLKVKTIAVDIEVQYARKYDNKEVSPHIFLLYDYFQYLADKFHIELLTYSFLSYVLQNRKIKKSSFINNKFLYVWFLNRHNIKSKNISYKR